jgi:hypothetical protein
VIAPAPLLDVPATAAGQCRTLVVHVRDPEGFDEYIGRGVRTARDQRCRIRSLWANPWKVGQLVTVGGVSSALDLDAVLRRYELATLPDIRDELGPDGWLLALSDLAGRRLGCWCADIGQPLSADDPLRCHGQILAKLADKAVGR